MAVVEDVWERSSWILNSWMSKKMIAVLLNVLRTSCSTLQSISRSVKLQQTQHGRRVGQVVSVEVASRK